ncbi:MAG: hypothetical protein COW42_05285 [Deltaproteobacteria bacterium CG17_big_fil_post_rev_8_21_14_2_50_63_7]|nr:MAG: hypothetical protein COW42_05285 [Deltaproteobacteria bacterium CG17_big_fil_post_rev_8_21_14_2_50_63_7]
MLEGARRGSLGLGRGKQANPRAKVLCGRAQCESAASSKGASFLWEPRATPSRIAEKHGTNSIQ